MNQLEGGNNHHQDPRSFFFPPSKKLMLSTVLDCSVDIFIDSRPPESIRDKTLSSLLGLMASIMKATIYSNPSVYAPSLWSILLGPYSGLELC